MPASLQLRPQNRHLGVVMQEVDENLAMFLGAETKSSGIDDFLNQEELSICRVHEDCLDPNPTEEEEEKEDSVENNTDSSSSSSSSQIVTVTPPMSEESASSTANGKSAVAAALSSSSPGKPKSKSKSTNIPRSKSQLGPRPAGRRRSKTAGPSVQKPASKNHPVSSRPSKDDSSKAAASAPRGGRLPPRQQQTTTTARISSKCSSSSDDDDDDAALNPVLVGTKMVERVVNMRKLAPPDSSSLLLNPKKAGFGRSLSKKSLEMAIRHMVLLILTSILIHLLFSVMYVFW